MDDIRRYHEPEREDQRNVHTVGLLLLKIKSGLLLAEAVFFWQRSKYIIASIARALRSGLDLRERTEVAVQGGGKHRDRSKDTLKDRLARYRQIKIGVIGRKSGKTISIPVWFVPEGEKVYLLPVQGSDTQWYRNVLKNPQIRIDARRAEGESQAIPVTDAKKVKSVVEKFREKYGAKDVKKYYSKFDAAVVIVLS